MTSPATALPQLNIPPSPSTVSVSVIETTSRIIARTGIVVQPQIAGHDEFDTPCFAFMITHTATNRKMLFDLGIRKDHENLTPNSKKEFLPGYPEREDSWIRQSDYEGREVREVSFSEPGGLKIGQYNAIDFLGDGSFYLLDCPGHTIGHLMGLARTTPTTFVLFAADCCHHGGEIRPSEFKPLPDDITPNPLVNHPRYPRSRPCPASLFTAIHPHKSRTKPFYELVNPRDLDSVREATRSQRKLEDFDANDDILVLSAHDGNAADVVDLYPKDINDWKEKGWKAKLHWAFLNDFEVA